MEIIVDRWLLNDFHEGLDIHILWGFVFEELGMLEWGQFVLKANSGEREACSHAQIVGSRSGQERDRSSSILDYTSQIYWTQHSNWH